MGPATLADETAADAGVAPRRLLTPGPTTANPNPATEARAVDSAIDVSPRAVDSSNQ